MERVSSKISLWGLRIWVEDRQAARGSGRGREGEREGWKSGGETGRGSEGGRKGERERGERAATETLSGDWDSRGSQL